jgi:hypothetical protein
MVNPTELDEVQTLLEHVLPDPGGYAQRLAMQVMTRWGQSAGSGASAFTAAAAAGYPGAAARDITLTDIVLTSDQEPAPEPPIDTNMLLAAALGACECWGLRIDCNVCLGQGSAGWIHPDPELFDEFVKPALARLSHPADYAGNEQGSD